MAGPLQSDLSRKSELELIRELERQSAEQVGQLRSHERHEALIAVSLRPGCSSQRGGVPPLSGFTRDVSKGGCQAIFPATVPVGDVFLFEFDHEGAELPPVLGRCVRCRFLREDAYEAAFAFFAELPVDEVGGDAS